MRLQTTMLLKALQALFLHKPLTLRLLLSSSSFVNDFQDQANFFSICKKNNTFYSWSYLVGSAAFDSCLRHVVEVYAGEFLNNHNIWYVLYKVLVEKILEGRDQRSIVKTFSVLTGVKNIAIAIAIFALFLLLSNFDYMKIPRVGPKTSARISYRIKIEMNFWKACQLCGTIRNHMKREKMNFGED